MIRLEQLTADEGPRLRAIRLRALRDAPGAFSTTFEEAAVRTPDEWLKQLRALPTFVAVDGAVDVGMVRCDRDNTSQDAAWLISMWVAPEVRRRHVGSALVDVVIEWARAQGMRRLLLEVAVDNAPAIALYARMGFTPNGVTSSFAPPRDHIREEQLELRL
jgi:ribosomal protein S18 acetylase RimI-like enzyme